ncbi:hypothetical protein AVEN_43147-1 [Araneus ventricosus]|uniref:Uncharacterized protein n=1 Tax=Araneus ventricosus TaxID=182803 RepID=A0A4Y2LXV2_ARAVE|nr:hypothetical protein AVEN_43147-1 [Araneus ventricosus]
MALAPINSNLIPGIVYISTPLPIFSLRSRRRLLPEVANSSPSKTHRVCESGELQIHQNPPACQAWKYGDWGAGSGVDFVIHPRFKIPKAIPKQPRGRGGVAVRPRIRRATGSKPNHPEDPPRMWVRCTLNHTTCVVLKLGERGSQLVCRPRHLTAVQNRPCVASKRDVNITKLK